MTDDDREIHPAPDPRDDDGIRVIGDADALFECSICGDLVHRFSVHYHGEGQYCPSCWDEVEPHMVEKSCYLCGENYQQDPYQSAVATTIDGEIVTRTKLCPDCTTANGLDD